MGAREIVLHFGTHQNREQGIEFTAEIRKHASPQLEASNIKILLENHYSYDYKGLNELGGEPADFLK